MSGASGYFAGLCAEDIVAKYYQNAGFHLAAQRWRGKRGEIDLIVKTSTYTVFVEVKKSKSHQEAAWKLGARQQARIYGTAEEFLASSPDGLNSECRFDLALVDNNGSVEIRENVIGHA